MHGAILAGTALSQPVTIERDAVGVASLRGATRADVAFATGYLHAQERFFQMDLMRRAAAGELAELLGAAALPDDRANRTHGFRLRAQAAVATLPTEQQLLLGRYTAGVNFGLQQLGARPFEYLVLLAAPQPWRSEDTLLVIFSMYLELQGQMEGRSLARGWIREHVPSAELAFWLPDTGAFDLSVDLQPLGPKVQPAVGATPAWLGLSDPVRAPQVQRLRPPVGSNAWAVAGLRSAGHAAILANDMHLSLRLPNTWYRVALQYSDVATARRIAGVTLPGTPAVIAGSNGQVAWGFSNAYVETLRMIELDHRQADGLQVKVGRTWESVRWRVESLRVRGEQAEMLQVPECSLGLLRRIGDRFFVVQWTAYLSDSADLTLAGLERAADVSQALAIAQRSGIPAQNIVVADGGGRIGWTVAGVLATRAAGAPAASSPPDDEPRSLTRLSPSAYPAVVDPREGRLVSANNRQLADPEYQRLGDGGADLGLRASRIADVLATGRPVNERQMHALALDDRAPWLDGWRDRVLRLLDPRALEGHPRRAELRQLLESSWHGRAAPDDASYRIVRAFVFVFYDRLFAGVDRQLAQLSPHSSYGLANPRWPLLLARLADEEPPQWLPAGQSWRDLLLDVLDDALLKVAGERGPLAQATWGQRNAVAIRHPLADALPGPVGAWLSAPADPLPGDDNVPRVSAPGFGQSMRLVVSPGHEDAAILDMPGGQSGHPLSPHFLSTHRAWVRGEPLPLLPGPTVHSLVLTVR